MWQPNKANIFPAAKEIQKTIIKNERKDNKQQ